MPIMGLQTAESTGKWLSTHDGIHGLVRILRGTPFRYLAISSLSHSHLGPSLPFLFVSPIFSTPSLLRRLFFVLAFPTLSNIVLDEKSFPALSNTRFDLTSVERTYLQPLFIVNWNCHACSILILPVPNCVPKSLLKTRNFNFFIWFSYSALSSFRYDIKF